MKRILLLSMGLLFVFCTHAWAQERTITGEVTSVEDGSPLPGVNVVLKGTSTGTVTGTDGSYSIKVSEEGGTLQFSFVGLVSEEVQIGDRSVIDVQMASDVKQLGELVVTALGVEREERALGYSVQKVEGTEVNKTKEGSFIGSLSGKVAGLNITNTNSLGGSVNAVLRGATSFTENNQVLFVVDGIPISNSNLNTQDQKTGGGGYDYGNAASDIDPESIASISVLKGGTAAALYGSDAARGVILITTKKGKKTDGIGVSVSHTSTFNQYDKSTFPEYQNEYGEGYGPYYGSTGGFYDQDINGDGEDELVVPAGEDASFGAKFDENLMVYGWDSFFPSLEDSYLQSKPWVAAENGPSYIFETGVNNVTNVSLQGGNDQGTFRLGYTNDDRKGILPNSEINKDVVDIHASYSLSDKLTVESKATYIRQEGKGRYGTGYESRNVMQSFRQWFATNVDLKEQKDAYFATKKNITWNANGFNDTSPHYFDNPYWVLHENFETDQRNRFFGKFQLTYDITDWMSFMGRIGIDSYSDLQEERFAIGSLDQPEYQKFERTFEQYNSDFMLNFDADLTGNISFSGLLGVNILDNQIVSTDAQTNGGLVVERIYSLDNSVSSLSPPTENDIHIRKYGYYAQATFGYMDMIYLDGTARIDESSTLPLHENTYFYPSVSGSFVFSELIEAPWLSIGKFRMGWASVANDAPPHSIKNTYTAADPFGSTPLFFLADVSNNPDLKSERTNEVEIGLEFGLFNHRIGGDVSVYKKNSYNQIMPVEVSTATGFNDKFVNAGEMENKGVELGLFASPVKTEKFEWQLNVNWAKNVNEVLSLHEDGENLLIYSAWSTAINARKGEPYGAITGTDYVYDEETGKRVVGSDGKYLRTESTTEVIGNIQPDWTGGVQNILSYDNLSFSFLIDVQQGGDIVSYDMGFGGATGILKETAGLNDKGNPKRDPVSEGGGILLDGVTADGSVNDTYAEAGTYLTPYGYYGGSSETGTYAPDAQLVYDASYIKLREVTLSYSLPELLLNNTPLTDVTVGVFGTNLWIIDKNLPYGDPEYTASSGNFRGIQNATLPSTKQYGFNVNIKF